MALGRLPDEDRGPQLRQSRTSPPRVPTALPNRVSRTRPTPSPPTGPGRVGSWRMTDDIDANGYWTVDDYEALMGLAAYRYLAQRIGDPTEVQWADAAVRRPPGGHQSHSRCHHRPLPSPLPPLFHARTQYRQPVQEPRRRQLGGTVRVREMGLGRASSSAPPSTGPGLTLIDSTYAYGFRRLRGKLPPNTFGGFPDDYYSTGLQRRLRQLGTGQQPLPRSGDLELRVHDRQRPGRSLLMVGELDRPLQNDALDREPSRRRPGILSPWLGHLRGEQGPARLAGGAAIRRRSDRGPGRSRPRGSVGAGPSPSPTSPPPTARGSASGSPRTVSRSP